MRTRAAARQRIRGAGRYGLGGRAPRQNRARRLSQMRKTKRGQVLSAIIGTRYLLYL